MNYQARSPLTPAELERRAAVLSAQKISPRADVGPERSDVRSYGERAAGILRDCKRDVALAPANDKVTVFRSAAKVLGDAAMEQWLPKDVVADRLHDIAVAHNSFGIGP